MSKIEEIFSKKVTELVKTTPNNMELGEKVRRLYFGSKNHIPQEEVNQDDNFYEKLKQYFEETPREKILEDWGKSAEYDKVGPTVDEFLDNANKHETLEEAAERYADFSNDHVPICFGDKFNPTSKTDFIAGAKYQAERMYSEEDMRNAFKGFTSGKSFKEWFEQFKKK
jgi:hypothetical protein